MPDSVTQRGYVQAVAFAREEPPRTSIRAPDRPGGVFGGVDWSRWSVVLLKPDCLRRDLAGQVLARLEPFACITWQERVTVADWQIFVHYWDLLADRYWLAGLDVAACLRRAYVGREVIVALAHGPQGISTPALLRSLLGSNDPSRAEPGTIRADLGADSLEAARAQRRLIENLIHTSDDEAACCGQVLVVGLAGVLRHSLRARQPDGPDEPRSAFPSPGAPARAARLRPSARTVGPCLAQTAGARRPPARQQQSRP